MKQTSNLLSSAVRELSCAQFNANKEILSVVYRIIDAPTTQTAERVVRIAAQRFLQFYLTQTSIAEDSLNLNAEDYYDELVRTATGLVLALDAAPSQFCKHEMLAFATAMDKLFAGYCKYIATLATIQEQDVDCDDENDEFEIEECPTCCRTSSADCEPCHHCCTAQKDETSSEKDSKQPNNKDLLSDEEAVARLFKAIFGMDEDEALRFTKREDK